MRQREPEVAARYARRLGVYGSTLRFDRLARDREAQTSARFRRVAALERFEDLGCYAL